MLGVSQDVSIHLSMKLFMCIPIEHGGKFVITTRQLLHTVAMHWDQVVFANDQQSCQLVKKQEASHS